jgi:hypothetical protein
MTWDAPQQSNLSLKQQTAPPQAKNASTLQTKTFKTSSARASKIPVPTSPPKSFKEANRMVQEAWKVAFPSLKFPVEVIGIYSTPTAVHSSATPATSRRTTSVRQHANQPTTPTS